MKGPWRQGLRIPKSCKKTMENQSSNPGARVGGFPSPATTNGKSIPRPWRQGERIPKSCKNQWKINHPTMAPGSEDPQVMQKQMENQSSNPGARVWGFPSPAKTNGKSIIQPWRQGRRILKSCKNQWKINPTTLAPGSGDSQVLQDLGLLRPWRHGWRIDFPLVFAKINGKSILQPWLQGGRIPKSSKKPLKINPQTMASGSEDSQVL